jgi:hypothetical protein
VSELRRELVHDRVVSHDTIGAAAIAGLLCEAVARDPLAQSICFFLRGAVDRGPGAASESALHAGRREGGALTGTSELSAAYA